MKILVDRSSLDLAGNSKKALSFPPIYADPESVFSP
jgi:hypothetical protein